MLASTLVRAQNKAGIGVDGVRAWRERCEKEGSAKWLREVVHVCIPSVLLVFHFAEVWVVWWSTTRDRS